MALTCRNHGKAILGLDDLFDQNVSEWLLGPTKCHIVFDTTSGSLLSRTDHQLILITKPLPCRNYHL